MMAERRTRNDLEMLQCGVDICTAVSMSCTARLLPRWKTRQLRYPNYSGNFWRDGCSTPVQLIVSDLDGSRRRFDSRTSPKFEINAQRNDM
jgi:hypothetical protein